MNNPFMNLRTHEVFPTHISPSNINLSKKLDGLKSALKIISISSSRQQLQATRIMTYNFLL